MNFHMNRYFLDDGIFSLLRVGAIWKVSILVPGSNVKCLSRDRRWPRLVAGTNIIIQFRTRYQFHVGDQKTIWSNNCLQTVRGKIITRSCLTCRPRRCCDPSPPWRSARTAGGWWASTTAARRAGESWGPRPHTQHGRRPEAATCGTQQFNLNPDKSFQWQRKIFK